MFSGNSLMLVLSKSNHLKQSSLSHISRGKLWSTEHPESFSLLRYLSSEILTGICLNLLFSEISNDLSRDTLQIHKGTSWIDAIDIRRTVILTHRRDNSRMFYAHLFFWNSRKRQSPRELKKKRRFHDCGWENSDKVEKVSPTSS